MDDDDLSPRKRSPRALEGDNEDESPSKRQAVEEEEEAVEEEAVEAEAVEAEEVEEAVEDNAAVDDETPTEESTSNPRQITKAPEAGIIKEVYVENFMCHAKFRVKFCRNVNFITGQNGSGKSAILAAIQICLGAGARRTHRARNLKDLVRKDAASNAPTQAKIRVSLLNRGSDAYKPEEYGETITVERTISLKGGYNGYKLYGHDSQEKSRSKKDLDAMLDKLNIQVENPVAVLDQEEAKKFLLGKADDKYEFFMKATELSRIDNSHASTADKIMDMQEARDKLESGLLRKKEQVSELKRKCEEHKQLDKMKLKLLQQQVNLSWTMHQSADAKYEEAAQTCARYDEKAQALADQVAQAEEAARNPDDQAVAAQNKVEELVKEAQTQAELKQGLEQQLRELLGPKKRLEREKKELLRKKGMAQENLRRAQEELQHARDQILQRTGESEQARLMAQLQDSETKMNGCKEKTDALKQSVSESLRKYEELEPSVQGAKNMVQTVKRQLQGVRGTIQSLQSAGDSLAMLGPRVKTMFQKVEEAKQRRVFKGPVVGPIGHYIKIAPGKEDFAAVAEFALGGGTLDRFIVTNGHDRQALQKIREQVRCASDCGIFQIGNNPRFNVPAPPVDGVETVATILTVENDLVFNCLVDNARIDITAVCRDTPTSEHQLLTRDGRGQDAIRGKISNVYTLPDGDFWTVKGGSRAIFTNERKLKKTIGVDKTVALQDAKAEEDQLKRELQHHSSEEARLEHEHTQYQRDWNRAKSAYRDNKKTMESLENTIETLRGELETTENVNIDTTELEQEISNYEQEREALAQEEEQLDADIEAMLPEIEETKAKINECAARNDRVLAEMGAAEQNLTQQLESKSQLIDQVEKKRKKLEKYRSAIEEAQTKVDQLQFEKDKALSDARKLTFRYQALQTQAKEGEQSDALRADPTPEELEEIEPYEPKNDASYYEAKVKSLSKKIDTEKEKRAIARDDPADAQEKYSRALADLKNDKEVLAEVCDKIEELEEDLAQRHARSKDMRKGLQNTTRIKFKELLSLNKYCGKLQFDHEGKTLDLLVSKDSSKKSRNKDVKALSGGERSYTTMCLLLALGENLETPFRVLDEFDIFLDGPTRRLTIQMLIHLATTKMQHRQFIFITPQDLAGIDPGPMLLIHRLLPPERSQVVGGPSQTTLNFTQS